MALRGRVGEGFRVAPGEWDINGGARVSTMVGGMYLGTMGGVREEPEEVGKVLGLLEKLEMGRVSPDMSPG